MTRCSESSALAPSSSNVDNGEEKHFTCTIIIINIIIIKSLNTQEQFDRYVIDHLRLSAITHTHTLPRGEQRGGFDDDGDWAAGTRSLVWNRW